MISARTFARIASAVCFVEKAQRHSTPDGIDGNDDGFPYGNQWVFGLGISGNKVTIYNALARRFGDPQGASQFYAVTPDVTVSFSNGLAQRIVWQWSPAGLTILTTPQSNEPSDDSTYLRGTVAVFDVVGSQCIIANGGLVQIGPIILPVFAPATT